MLMVELVAVERSAVQKVVALVVFIHLLEL